MNDKTKLIVVGLDDSPRAADVIAAARVMAERLSAQVVLVSCVDAPEYEASLPPELRAWQDTSPWLQLKQRLHDELERAARQFAPKTIVSRRVVYGAAWSVLCEAARELDASLVIVGAHGYRALERFAGTTASRVANRAGTSVLVVRRSEDTQVTVAFDDIVVAHDGSPRAASVTRAALGLASVPNSKITLVRAINPATALPPDALGFAPVAIEQALVASARTELEQVRAPWIASHPMNVEVSIGMPADVVLTVAKNARASLVVIGSHGFSGLDHLLGTTAGRIVNLADRSVLVVRSPAEQ